MDIDPQMAPLIRQTAERLGIDPVALATTISYESAGSFDPWKAGPTTKWGQHRGLIQMGEPQRAKYGITEKSTLPEHFTAIEGYLRDAGVKPGMGLLDVYSAVNAGAPGLYGRSDAHAGGAPGTVADKVRGMAAHTLKARALLGESIDGGGAAPRVAVQKPSAPVAGAQASAPLSLAPPVESEADAQQFAGLIEVMRKLAQREEENRLPNALPALQIGRMPMNIQKGKFG